MLTIQIRATVGQKQSCKQRGQQQPCSSEMRVQRVDQAGTRKNGHTRHGKQNHQCKACTRQCGAMADDRLIADERRTMVERLLRERVSLRGICRTVGVSLTWLLHCMVECFTACPEDFHVQPPAQPTGVVMSRLEAEADERWSFVVRRVGAM